MNVVVVSWLVGSLGSSSGKNMVSFSEYAFTFYTGFRIDSWCI